MSSETPTPDTAAERAAAAFRLYHAHIANCDECHTAKGIKCSEGQKYFDEGMRETEAIDPPSFRAANRIYKKQLACKGNFSAYSIKHIIIEELAAERAASEQREAELLKSRDLIPRNAHAHLGRKYKRTPLWAFVRDMCGLGSTSSVAFCIEMGWNPHADGAESLPERTALAVAPSVTTEAAKENPNDD